MTIKIDLAGSRRARPFPKKERLWTDDLQRLIQKIKTHTEDLESFFRDNEDPTTNDNAPTLSLAIFGPVGSGKSSLLKTLVSEAKKQGKKQGKKIKKMDGLEHVASLDVLQPARFGPDDHLLYATVAACLAAHIKPQNENPEYEALSDVLKDYRAVSGDLRVLHRESLPEGVDPHALAAEVVQRHTSALNLRQRLDTFFDSVANDLNTDVKESERQRSVVLLPVDDLDLNPAYLYEGLRELQAYLLHPRIVPVFCFTDRLAEEFLAAEYAKTLRYADVRRRRSGSLPVSEQLAVQQLAKCFPVRNRIRLIAAPAVLQAAVLKTTGEKAKIQDTLEKATSLLYGVADLDARHPVPAALRPSTLRRQFQVIESMGDAMNDELVPAEARTWGTRFDRAAWSLLNVHRDVLREVGLQLEDLYGWTPPRPPAGPVAGPVPTLRPAAGGPVAALAEPGRQPPRAGDLAARGQCPPPVVAWRAAQRRRPWPDGRLQ